MCESFTNKLTILKVIEIYNKDKKLINIIRKGPLGSPGLNGKDGPSGFPGERGERGYENNYKNFLKL